MKHIFPKWFYHKDIMPEGQIIRSEEAFETLGKGWVESPAHFDGIPTSEPIIPVVQEKESNILDGFDEINEMLAEEKPEQKRSPKRSKGGV